MTYIKRTIEARLKHSLERGKSVLLLGARQTGKTTLINQINVDFSISFIQPSVRQRYEKNPSVLTGEIEALFKQLGKVVCVVVDEVQKVPEILDIAQDLIDRDIAQFVLTGSSARKLRAPGAINFLPGRVVALRLDPLSISELREQNLEPNKLLLYGSLPEIVTTKDLGDRETDLYSYVTTYLEEEIRAEAAVRNVGAFSRFLELAASESGNIVNFAKLSQEIGVSHTTIASYYQVLEDCLVAECIEPLIDSKTRRKLTRASKYLIFDLGIRRVSAREGVDLPIKTMGLLFEQFIGLELVRHARLSKIQPRILFWRDPSGPEVDFIIHNKDSYVAIEVKWSTEPTLRDAKHLEIFLREYPTTKMAYIVCRVPRRIVLTPNITAIPWQEIPQLFAD